MNGMLLFLAIFNLCWGATNVLVGSSPWLVLASGFLGGLVGGMWLIKKAAGLK